MEIASRGALTHRGLKKDEGLAVICRQLSTQWMLFHPHIHCVVPSGGLAPGRKHWIKGSDRFFLPLEVLKSVFRGKFVEGLKEAFAQQRLHLNGQIRHLARGNCFAAFVRKLHRHKWVVYAKPPFGGPEQVLRYLGRYTHRVAISNHRLLAFDGDNVTFRWRDYAHGNVQRTMTINAEEFIRRFLLHVLPKGFVHPAFRFYGQLPTINILRTVPPAAENGAGSSFRRNPSHQSGAIMPLLSRAHDRHRKIYCDADYVEIRFEMFFRYVVAEISNRKVHDVLLHAGASVCLHLASPSSLGPDSSDFQQRHPKTDARSPCIPFRCRLSAPVGSLPVKISTRIPVLSP